MRVTLAPDIPFTPVDPRLSTVKTQAALLCAAIPCIALIVLCLTVWRNMPWTWVFPGALVLLTLWDIALIGRRVRAMGYAELQDELIIRSGIMFRNLEVVPYGRMQQVTVESGPLMSRQGLASVTLVTAAATSNAVIPGVPAHEAERLRAKLTALGEANLEGL